MPAKRSELADRVVVVTGAARGMGAATAKGFLQAGANVAALDLSWNAIDQYWGDADKTRQDMKLHGSRFLCLECDICDDQQLDRTYDAVLARFGAVHTLINNAALIQHHVFQPTGRVKVLDTRDADWEKMFAVNLMGALKTIRRFVRPIIASGGGAIVNIVSSGVMERTARPHSLEQPYMASKAALASMGVYLASELREHNVAVNSVSPGHAEMTGWQLIDAARSAQGRETAASRQVPEHIVPLLAFLASRDASNGPSGCHIDTNEWNLLHGEGPPTWWLREHGPGSGSGTSRPY